LISGGFDIEGLGITIPSLLYYILVERRNCLTEIIITVYLLITDFEVLFL